MKKHMSDEEIRELLETSQKSGEQIDSEDLRTYRILFEALAQEPEEGLSYHFAEKVGRRAYQQHESRQKLRTLLVSGLTILLLLVCSLLALLAYPSETTVQLQDLLWQHRGPVLFALVMFLLVQWADYRLLKRNSNRNPG